jgi:phage tail tape-measure protein
MKPENKGVPEVVGGVAGGATGALAGAIAGPPGMIVGAIVGAMAGVAAGVALDGPSDKELRDEELDREIGVTEGNIGDPSLQHPPPKTAHFSAIASVVADSESSGDENKESNGPIENDN